MVLKGEEQIHDRNRIENIKSKQTQDPKQDHKQQGEWVKGCIEDTIWLVLHQC